MVVCARLNSHCVFTIGEEAVHSGPVFREHFARVCFEALLQFSFVNTQDNQIGEHTDSNVCACAYTYCMCIHKYCMCF